MTVIFLQKISIFADEKPIIKLMTMKKIFSLFFSLLVGTGLMYAQTAAIVLGHRGGRAEQDENTLSAFQNAYAAGIHAYETDVRMSKDGALIVSHDGSLKRRCGIDREIEDMTAQELRTVKTTQGHPLLFLDDLLDFLKDKSGLYVEFEMKTGDAARYPDGRIAEYCEKTYKALKKKMPADANYAMTSFDYRPLRYLTEHHPDQPIMLISGSPVCEKTIEAAVAVGAKRLACNLNGTCRGQVEAAHKRGLTVNLWPGERVDDTLLALLLGADYLCTDIPIQMKKYLDKYPQLRPVKFGAQ